MYQNQIGKINLESGNDFDNENQKSDEQVFKSIQNLRKKLNHGLQIDI